MDGQKHEETGPHRLTRDDRRRLSLTGVTEVDSFDENTMLLRTNRGLVSVRGEGLHIERIDLEAGALELRGRIRELSYDEPARGGLLARLFS